MPISNRAWLARLALALLVVPALVWLARLDYGRKISTDVLDLMPVDERSPELALVRALASERQARVALFVCQPATTGDGQADVSPKFEQAVAAFVGALRASPVFAEVERLDDAGAREAMGAAVFRQRFALLLPTWLEEMDTEHARVAPEQPWAVWLADRVAAGLTAFLSRPEAGAFEPLLPRDPLLLMPAFVEKLDAFSGDGLAEESGRDVRVWARLAVSPLREEGQGPVLAAVEQAVAAARAIDGTFDLRWTAVSRFATESRLRLEAEMEWLNLGSLAAVVVVAVAGVRRWRRAWHLAPVVLCGLLGAWTVTTLAFERVHVLVFVLGSLLGGVAIDYGFYLAMQPRREGEGYGERVRRLMKPLLSSSLTAVLGFSLLLLSELPLIRQLGIFVSAGLLSALVGALLWFAQAGDALLETRAFIRAPVPGLGWRPLRWMLFAAAGVVVVAGIGRLRWRDDIRDLDIPAPELWANDRAVRSSFGETGQRAVYLTRGTSAAGARRSLGEFLAWHAAQSGYAPVVSPGLVLPHPDTWEALDGRLARLEDFPVELRAALATAGFEEGAFDSFFANWSAAVGPDRNRDYDTMVAAFTGALRGPLSLLASVGPGSVIFASMSTFSPAVEPPAATATVAVSQLSGLNQLFARYRASALRLSLLGLGLVGLSVFALYGWRRGAGIFALPVGACLIGFGLLGVSGATLNLFHLLGAFLGVCLSHNYAIFAAENAAVGDASPPSIRLSALSTAASFAVLAFSQIPAVSAIGATVATIVAVALGLVEVARARAKVEVEEGS